MLKHVALLLLGTQICAVNPGLQTWERGADADGASSVYVSEAGIDWGRRDADGASSVYPSDVSEMSKSKTGQKGKYIPSIASTEQGEEEEVDPRLFMQFNKEERNMNWGRGDADGASSVYPSDVSEISKSKTGQKAVGKYIPSVASTEKNEEEKLDLSLFVASNKQSKEAVSHDWGRKDADGASSIYPSDAGSEANGEFGMPSNQALMDGLNRTAVSLSPKHSKSPRHNTSSSSIDTNDFDDSNKSLVINYDESPNKNYTNNPHTPDQSNPKSHANAPSTPKTPRNPVGRKLGPNARVILQTPETVQRVRVAEPDAELNHSLPDEELNRSHLSLENSLILATGILANGVAVEVGKNDNVPSKVASNVIAGAAIGLLNSTSNNPHKKPQTNNGDCCAGCIIS